MGTSLQRGSALPGMQRPDGPAGQDSRATPAPWTLHGTNRPDKRTVLISRCCSEAPLARVRNLSASVPDLSVWRRKGNSLHHHPRPFVVMMQVTGTRDIKGNTGKVPNPARKHHVSGSYFSVTYDWGLHSDVLHAIPVWFTPCGLHKAPLGLH